MLNRKSALLAFYLVFLICSALIVFVSCDGSGDSSTNPDPVIEDDDDTIDADEDDDSIHYDDDTDDDNDTDDDVEPGSVFVEMIPMRDGVRLWTKVFLPDPIPWAGASTVMNRSPYRSEDSNEEFEKRALVFVERGMAFVQQDCRGRNGSEGVFRPYADEHQDALDTSEWIVSQAWSNGGIGAFGSSYDGFTALAAAADNPYMKVVVAEEAPRREAGPRGVGGAVFKGRLEWLHTLEYGTWMSDELITMATNTLDVTHADETILGWPDPYWQLLVETPNPADPYWDEPSLDEYIPQICAPILNVFSMELHWDDPIEIWRGLREQGCEEYRDDQRLMLTPDPHGYHTFMLPYLRTPVNKLLLDYMDAFLGEGGGGSGDLSGVPLVQYRSLDDATYIPSDTWPPQVDEKTYYLGWNDGGYLDMDAPGGGTPTELYVDPATMDPCGDGYPLLDFSTLALFPGPYIAGTVTATINISSTTPDTDLFLDLVEYRLNGERRFISSAEARVRYREGQDRLLSPGQIVPLYFELYPVIFQVGMGSRLSLEIRAAHCGFFENPHTGEELGLQTHWEDSVLSIHHDADNPSFITLPDRP